MDEEKQFHQPKEIGFTIESLDPATTQVLQEVARKDANAYMAAFFGNNGGRKIPANEFEVSDAELIKYSSEVRATLLKNQINMTEAMFQKYETTFRQECALGYPVDIN